MIFRLLSIDLEKIVYSFSFYKDIEEVFEYGIEFVTIDRKKSINYLFALLQVTKDLPQEVKEDILYRTLITEFKEEYFLEYFYFKFPLDLELYCYLEDHNCDCYLENNICNHHYRTYSSDRYSLDSFYYLSD